MDAQRQKNLSDHLAEQISRLGRPWGLESWDPRVLDAIRRVPRHDFVPEVPVATAYADAPQPIGYGQTISQPTVVAMMAQALELAPDHVVLEIGTGSGYHAAVVACLAKHVYSIEIRSELADSARARLEALGVRNVTVRCGDGALGMPEHAPFDRVLLTAAPVEIPSALVSQLADGGVLVAPIGDAGALQRLVRLRKKGATVEHEDLGGVMFVPMV